MACSCSPPSTAVASRYHRDAPIAVPLLPREYAVQCAVCYRRCPGAPFSPALPVAPSAGSLPG